jgi:hypothetical protein
MLTVVPASLITLGLYRGSLATVSFGLLGMVLGVVLYCILRGTIRDGDRIPAALLVLLLAWSASLSVGYNFPTLLLGPLFTVLAAFVYSAGRAFDPRFLTTMLVVGGAAILLAGG